MIVVSDSSPIIILATVGHLRLLRDLFSEILIPDAVYREIVVQGAGRAGADEVQGADWIRQETVHNTTLVNVLHLELDEGEAEAIALALERGADLVLIDERSARLRAADLDLKFVGVLGVLIESKRQGFLTEIRPVLDAMRLGAGFWISESLYQHVLDSAGE